MLFPSNEVIWYSERDNWGQLYLYDLATGKLKNRITTGEGNVTQLLRMDEKARTLIFQAVGKEKGRDPYFTHLYRIGMDGTNQVLLTPEDANHEIALHDSGRYFVEATQAGRAAGRRASRPRRQAGSATGERPTSRSSPRPDGSHPCRSP